jgi:nucleotide-binding universal stress UspA family protein
MLPIHTILHPTDFSPRSQHAYWLSCALARDHGASIILVHVLPPPIVVYGNGIVPPMPEDNRALQEQSLKTLQAQTAPIQAEIRLVDGDPVTEIVRVSKETGSDLIVMGTHGWTGLSRLLMGSVAEGVVRKAPCPVLTIKNPVETKAEKKKAGAEPVVANR